MSDKVVIDSPRVMARCGPESTRYGIVVTALSTVMAWVGVWLRYLT
ncbi:hypothetical protein [Actinosynnema sp. ALI-1.44]|nr:hypothetical protein [Actinosynnema sp. ALI-1.44]